MRKYYIPIYIIMVLFLTGCTINHSKSLENNTENEENTIPEEKESPNMQTYSEEEESASENKTTETTNIVLELFVPNQNVTGFDIKEILIESLSPEAILEALAANTYINITLNSFIQLEDGGEKALKLDVSSNLSDFLGGTTGEYMTMGSICNTFLTAYDADKILITTDGTTPRTGHIDYSAYRHFYNVSFTLYIPTQSMNGFDNESCTVRILTPEAIIAALIERAGLADDILVHSFTPLYDGEHILKLDVSSELSDQLEYLSADEEYMIMGSLCNSFLSAYAASKISITVDGKILESNNYDYSGYLEFYK